MSNRGWPIPALRPAPAWIGALAAEDSVAILARPISDWSGACSCASWIASRHLLTPVDPVDGVLDIIALTVTACSLLFSQTIVDASGAGDFVDLQDAIDAASAGDVLLIQPGDYAAFTLDKQLSLLGPTVGAKPKIVGTSTIDGAAAFTLAGLDLERLDVRSVAGHGEIDACNVSSPAQRGISIFDCERIQIERTSVAVTGDYYSLSSSVGPGAALYCEHSNVTVVACSLTGGNSAEGELEYTDGGEGLYAVASDVLVADTDARGGVGGSFDSIFSFCEVGGSSFANYGGQLVLRGSGSLANGGEGGSFCADGASVLSADGGVALVSGYDTPNGFQMLGGGSVSASADEPFLTLLGSDAVGTARRLRLHAGVDEPVLVFGSTASAALAIAGFEGWIGIDAGQIVFSTLLVGQGVLSPKTLTLNLPQDFVGLQGKTLHFQGVAPFASGTLDPSAILLTNPTALVLRF